MSPPSSLFIQKYRQENLINSVGRGGREGVTPRWTSIPCRKEQYYDED